MRYSLVLLNGPSPGAGISLDANGEAVTIGRDAARTLPVHDHLCSRLHSRVWFDAGQWHAEDCDSRNGTFVNSQQIQRTTLRPGDVIRLGECLIVFVRERDPNKVDGWQPSKLATSTFVARVSEPDKREAIVEHLRTNATSKPMRNAAILCRLATDMHRQDSVGGLVKVMTGALVDGTRADDVDIWLVGTDGRLTHAGGTKSIDPGSADLHVLASLSVENNEALLVQQDGIDPNRQMGDSTIVADDEAGMLMSVPIPGRTSRRGAIECIRSGEDGPFESEDLDLAIAIAHQGGLALENIEHREQLEQTNEQLRETVSGQTRIIGDSSEIKELLETVGRVASTHSTVLVRGESGSGKELVARMIHESSARRAGPYIPVNCAAFNEALLESELFGHEKGAFTGADQRRLGQFERAHAGTIFLDEIGEMSGACQARLLRLLEGHPFERVGGSDSIQVDVRVVAATHRTLTDLIDDGEFREDLYFRLRVIELQIPPLRDRGHDMLTLAVHFLDHFRKQIGRGPSRLSEAASRAIRDYQWPGNVRELKNAIERSVVLGRDEEVKVADLALPQKTAPTVTEGNLMSLADAEKQHIAYVLNEVSGNKTQACKVLGIGRGTLYKKLEDS